MKPALLLFAAGAALFSLNAPARAGDDAPAAGFSAFRLLKTRPIFDPDRVPGRSASPTAAARPAAATVSSRPPGITLTGVLIAPEKTLAFFTGTRSEFNRVLPVHGKIADFTITAISASQVELERDGKPLTVAVGRPIPLEGSVAASLPGDAEPAEAAPPPSPEAAPEKNDVLRRMLERRQKEIAP